MPTQLSHAKSILTINGEQVTGYGEGEAPIEIEGQDLVSFTFGSDGTLFLEDTAIQGGEVTVMLGQSSPYIGKLVAYANRIKRGERIDFELSYGDPSLGYSVACAAGAMVSSDAVPIPGKDFEAKFVFETIYGDMDGVQFAAPPEASAAA